MAVFGFKTITTANFEPLSQYAIESPVWSHDQIKNSFTPRILFKCKKCNSFV